MCTMAVEATAAEVNRTIDETQKLLESLATVIDIRHSVVSSILSEYREIAENTDIPFNFDVSVPQNPGISAVDLYPLPQAE